MTREQWEEKQNALKKEYKYVSNGTPGEVTKVEVKKEGEEPVVTESMKMDWNKFLSWLDTKKLRGLPELDKNNKGNVLFEQFLKENPDTSLSAKSIPSIRKAYMDLRDDRMKEIQSGKANFSGKPEEFMKHIVLNEQTQNPNYVGQHLTQTYFPGAKYNVEQDGKVVESKSVDILGKGGVDTSKQELSKMK
jgi:hypothetical protein